MGDFGNKFRKARESKELSLDDVSKVIKITPRMLRAIEEENFDQLPGGVFNKGFIRSYAKQLGLDPEESVNEYLEKMRQAQIEAQQAWQPPQPEPEKRTPAKAAPAKTRPSRPAPKAETPVEVEELPELHLPREKDIRPRRKEHLGRPSSDIPWRIVAVALLVVILAAVLWIRHSHRIHSQATVVPAPQTQQVAQSAAPSSPAPPTSSPAATTPEPNAPTPDSNSPDDKNDVTVRNFDKTLPKTTEKSTGALALTVRASENSWLFVIGDGQPITEETLIAPAHTTFHANRDFVVKVGNAAAITFSWNGQEIPAQGGEGEVKTLVFDANGMHPASSSSNQ